ncbi:MAG: VOC family protein [Candidatus Sulfotelmatobacter sp.]
MKFTKLTPNLVVRNVEASLNFYRTVLGFKTGITVPDAPPYVFGSVTSDGVEIFFNDHAAVAEDYPALGAKPIGGSLTLFHRSGEDRRSSGRRKEKRGENHHAVERAILRDA